MFQDADADPQTTIQDPKLVFYITNTGRKSVAVSKIWGEYKKVTKGNKPGWILTTIGLPKMIEVLKSLDEVFPSNSLSKIKKIDFIIWALGNKKIA